MTLIIFAYSTADKVITIQTQSSAVKANSGCYGRDVMTASVCHYKLLLCLHDEQRGWRFEQVTDKN